MVRRERQLRRHLVRIRLHVPRCDLGQQLHALVCPLSPLAHNLDQGLRVVEEVRLGELALVD